MLDASTVGLFPAPKACQGPIRPKLLKTLNIKYASELCPTRYNRSMKRVKSPAWRPGFYFV
jgi:hypothetical protein